MVGKPWISSGTSLAVASTLAMTTLEERAGLVVYIEASSSYLGARLARKRSVSLMSLRSLVEKGGEETYALQ